MLQDRLIEEIKQIPSDKLEDVYDLLHHFRMDLARGQQIQELPRQRPIGLAKGMFEVPGTFFEPLPDDFLDACEGK